MSVLARRRLLIGIALAALVVSGVFVWTTYHRATERALAEAVVGHELLAAMLNQETGSRGFLLTGRETFLEPYHEGRRAMVLALAAAREAAAGDAYSTRSLRRQVRLIEPWQRLADRAVSRQRAEGIPQRDRTQGRRRELFDRFRAENKLFHEHIEDSRERALAVAERVPVAVMVGLALLFGAIGYVMLGRGAREARRRYQRDTAVRSSQEEFAETLQAMRSEGEAHTLVKVHLERALPGAEVAVLNRNNSDNRLEAATPLQTGDPLAQLLAGAAPEACVAIRLGRRHEQGTVTDPLLHCELCGASGRDALCSPSLVGGEVIGSVLVESDRPLDGGEQERVQQSVTQAAPVLANLRNLALAELRAATDQLTGLPNRRAVYDGLKRMVAQAVRNDGQLGAVLLDLDHFKQVNDIHGHGVGDDVLAAVGATLSATLRAGDFAGRYGGEEFLLLLPDTDRAGAVALAENVRHALERVRIPGVDRPITASLGTAVLPDDAIDGESLVRQADRALYAAKAAGRNRVHVAEPPGTGSSSEQPHLA